MTPHTGEDNRGSDRSLNRGRGVQGGFGKSRFLTSRVLVGLVLRTAVRAARAAGLGAGAQRLVDDLLDRARATAAFGAAAETAIDLPRGAGKAIGRRDGGADILVAQDVAGTNNHGKVGQPALMLDHRY